MLAQGILRSKGEMAVGELFVVGKVLAEVVEEFGDVFAVLGKRRDVDARDGELVVKFAGQAFFQEVKRQSSAAGRTSFASPPP